jgi:hypothetical protein
MGGQDLLEKCLEIGGRRSREIGGGQFHEKLSNGWSPVFGERTARARKGNQG